MRLSALLTGLPRDLAPRHAGASADPVVRGIAYDSRRVAPGDLFVALRGEQVDGHAYTAQALGLGAVALLVEESPADVPDGIPVVCVPQTRRALAPIATRFFGSPAAELSLIGVTGTNGKTSVTYLLESILLAAGRRVGLIGTVELRYAGHHERTLNTTPESLDLQRTLRAMRTEEIDAAVMEVSSHGIALGRIDGCRFEVGAFTNLSQDHLDFHGSMESYRSAKTAFFERYLTPSATAVVNLDDPAAGAFSAAARTAGARVVGVSRRAGAGADIHLEAATVRLEGTDARLHFPGGALELALPLVGDFNVENLLVAAGAAHALGIGADVIARGVAACPQVPGRMERVGADLSGPTVLVDYAHTPDAVEKLLRAVRPLARGRVVTVFGCGGDRDRAKRPLMAEAAARSSHRVIATSDNPRSEDPLHILEDVERGLKSLRRVEPDALASGDGVYCVVPDRRLAIARAIASAGRDDIVVLAGKGHEDYQIVGHERLPFDDRLEARVALEREGPA